MPAIFRPASLATKTHSSLEDQGFVATATPIRVKGKTVFLPSLQIGRTKVIVRGKWIKLASVHDEDLIEGDTLDDPDSFILQLKSANFRGDLFTFAQRLPATSPVHAFHLEWDNLAVIPISTYDNWWSNRAGHDVRSAVRKGSKAGVTVNVVDFDDVFLKGVSCIYNETPIRQGKPFWHFQKSLEDVRAENLTYPERNTFLGAYYQDELIGFMRLICSNRTAVVMQLLTKMQYSNKKAANCLIAKAVEICTQRGLLYLTYGSYIYNDPKSSLTQFKRRNGFEQVLLPRYYVPLTLKGRIALALGLHHGLKERLPEWILTPILKLRNLWNRRRIKSAQLVSES